FDVDGIQGVGGPLCFGSDVVRQGVTVFKANTSNPASDLFVFGISLGGILSGILPAVEPAIIAAAPTSGAGGLADVGLRSTLDQVVQAVFLERFGPLFASCPCSAWSGLVDPQSGIPCGACNGG